MDGLVSRHVGGLIPYVRAGRDRHTMETTWWFEVTWLRARLKIETCW